MDRQPDMQDLVQAAVLHTVADEAAVNPARILRNLPRADERDVARAVEILLREGCLVIHVQRPTYLGDLAPVELTDNGRARLQQ